LNKIIKVRWQIANGPLRDNSLRMFSSIHTITTRRRGKKSLRDDDGS
jgi:hypothetical protein